MIHRSNEEFDVAATVTAGELTGLAQDRNTTEVTVDVVARADIAAQRAIREPSQSASSHKRPPPPMRRKLRDILQDSTEKWLLPTADSERAYLEELESMGYEPQQVEQRLEEQGHEYHEMLELGCKRKPQFQPCMIPNLNRVRVVDVSAGYAHTMLLSDNGVLYAAGYNDRGQLGLG